MKAADEAVNAHEQEAYHALKTEIISYEGFPEVELESTLREKCLSAMENRKSNSCALILHTVEFLSAQAESWGNLVERFGTFGERMADLYEWYKGNVASNDSGLRKIKN